MGRMIRLRDHGEGRDRRPPPIPHGDGTATAGKCEVTTKMQRRRHLPITDQGRWLAAVVRRTSRVLRRADQLPRARRFPANRGPPLVPLASAAEPATTPRLEPDAPNRCTLVAFDPHRSSVARPAASRLHPRQEPSAVILHAGICAGGDPRPRGRGPSLPQPQYLHASESRPLAARLVPRSLSPALSHQPIEGTTSSARPQV